MNLLRRSDESASGIAPAGKWLATVAAVLGFAFLAGQAEASCGNDQRVSVSDSQCLWASHTSGSYEANNSCLHEITIKIDIRNGKDSTRTIRAATWQWCQRVPEGVPSCVTVPSGITMTGPGEWQLAATEVSGSINTSWWRSIRAVTCCSDLSDSCNRRASDDYDNP